MPVLTWQQWGLARDSVPPESTWGSSAWVGRILTEPGTDWGVDHWAFTYGFKSILPWKPHIRSGPECHRAESALFFGNPFQRQAGMTEGRVGAHIFSVAGNDIAEA